VAQVTVLETAPVYSRIRYLLSRLHLPSRRRRLLLERLGEPIHLNVISLFVALLGGTRAKIDFDLVVRQQFAFSVLYAADLAKRRGYRAITAIEFGVASGAGLLNICQIADLVEKETGIRIAVAGFDTGTGMPRALDHRDLPELWQQGDFKMDEAALRARLPKRASLHVGPLEETIPQFMAAHSVEAPIGFISFDVDYYSSTVQALQIFDADAKRYLPMVCTYLDDIIVDEISDWSGELAAIHEFNARNPMRKIAPFPFLREKRMFQRARWIGQIFLCHVHDHPLRQPGAIRAPVRDIRNEFIE
jgi:hypothetical protein